MFKSWNIIDCGLRKESTGHQYWETKALSDELLRRGKEVGIFCHGAMPESSFPGAEIYSAFPLYYYSVVSKDPHWAYLENFIVHNRSFEEALSKLDKSLFADSIVLFPTLSERQLLGALRWLARFSPETRPRAGIFLYPLYDWSQDNAAARLYRRLWQERPPALNSHVFLLSRMAGTAEQLKKLLGTEIHVAPSLLRPPEDIMSEAAKRLAGQAASNASGPMIVSFIGGARFERGGQFLREVVDRSSALNIRFFIQAKEGSDPKFDIALLTSLRDRKNVDFHEGQFDQKVYYDVIAGSIVLLPYKPEHYALKSSGVYLEAKCLGAPVIVPEGTWMAEDVKQNGNGLVFRDYNGAAIADCVARAYQERERLFSNARTCALAFAEQHGASRYVDTVEALLGAKSG